MPCYDINGIEDAWCPLRKQAQAVSGWKACMWLTFKPISLHDVAFDCNYVERCWGNIDGQCHYQLLAGSLFTIQILIMVKISTHTTWHLWACHFPSCSCVFSCVHRNIGKIAALKKTIFSTTFLSSVPARLLFQEVWSDCCMRADVRVRCNMYNGT